MTSINVESYGPSLPGPPSEPPRRASAPTSASEASPSSGEFTYVDLFAGCGGLSLGLKRAEGRHLLAVEKSPMAAETYFKNLIDRDGSAWRSLLSSSVPEQMRAGLVAGPLEGVLKETTAMAELAREGVDLVAGGPPCQGFSLAGRRNSKDPRNQLVWEFLDFVSLTNPKFVIIENVVGMHRKFDAGSTMTPFEAVREALSRQGDFGGYWVQGVLLNAVHYGAPQSRPRMMLVAVRHDVGTTLNIRPTPEVLSSSFSAAPAGTSTLIPPSTVRHGRTVAEALFDLDPAIPRSKKDGLDRGYLAEIRDAGLWGLAPEVEDIPNHDLRNHRDSTKRLFALLELLSRLNVLPEARRARASNFSRSAEEALLSSLKVHQDSFPASTMLGGYSIESPESLFNEVRALLTRKHSQTVLEWTRPARTIVTIPDDYIHPLLPRTFSVRELARLQGFPDSFQFYGKVTTGGLSRRVDVPQYTQVGNAVSPYVGYALGQLVADLSRKVE